MSDEKKNDPGHHGDHKGSNDDSHDEHSEPKSGKHKEKGSAPSDTIAPADDDIIIK